MKLRYAKSICIHNHHQQPVHYIDTSTGNTKINEAPSLKHLSHLRVAFPPGEGWNPRCTNNSKNSETCVCAQAAKDFGPEVFIQNIGIIMQQNDCFTVLIGTGQIQDPVVDCTDPVSGANMHLIDAGVNVRAETALKRLCFSARSTAASSDHEHEPDAPCMEGGRRQGLPADKESEGIAEIIDPRAEVRTQQSVAIHLLGSSLYFGHHDLHKENLLGVIRKGLGVGVQITE